MSRIIVFLAALAFAGGALPATLQAVPQIRLVADRWCPYNCDPQSDHPGFMVEIAREVFAATGRSVEYEILAWPRAIAEARAGRQDGIVAAIPRDAPDFLYPPEAEGSSSLGIAVLAGSEFRFDGPASLEDKVVGAVAGYAFSGATGSYIMAHEKPGGRVQVVSGNDALVQNLRKLVAGRVDVVVDDANVLAETIRTLGLSAEVKIVGVTTPLPLYIAFSPACREASGLAKTLSDGVVRLRRSGRLAAILARYHVADWK